MSTRDYEFTVYRNSTIPEGPAYPKNGRTSRDGVLYVHGVPVDETDFGRDPFAPVRDARIMLHLEDPCVVFDVEAVRGGCDELGAALRTARAHGMRVGVADAGCAKRCAPAVPAARARRRTRGGGGRADARRRARLECAHDERAFT
ncbi:MAG: four-carbon acid sugar kinase family protein [Vulcanimicrobiaceae bacterium]